MNGLVVILTALVAGLVGAGCGLGVAFVVLRSRQKGPAEGATTTSSPGAAAHGGDPAAQATKPLLGDGAPDLYDDDEEDDAIPTTVFRADQLDLDALIEQAERLKSER